MILLIPFLVRDLYLGRLSRRVVVAGLAIVGLSSPGLGGLELGPIRRPARILHETQRL